MKQIFPKDEPVKTFDKAKANAAQIQYCKDKGAPMFAPSGGVCWKCRRNIYEPYKIDGEHESGYTVERASRILITGCPHCHISYCE